MYYQGQPDGWVCCLGLLAGLLVMAVLVTALARSRARAWREDLERLRGLRDAAHRELSELRDGDIVRVTGKVEPDERAVRAPLTGRSCVAYRVDVVASPARRLVQESGAASFWLVAGAERLLVEGGGAVLLPFEDHYEPGGPSDPLAAPTVALLERHGEAPRTEDGLTRRLELYECVVREGDWVDVKGRVRLDRAHAGSEDVGYRSAPEVRARIVAADEDELVIAKRRLPPML